MSRYGMKFLGRLVCHLKGRHKWDLRGMRGPVLQGEFPPGIYDTECRRCGKKGYLSMDVGWKYYGGFEIAERSGATIQ